MNRLTKLTAVMISSFLMSCSASHKPVSFVVVGYENYRGVQTALARPVNVKNCKPYHFTIGDTICVMPVKLVP